MPIPLLFAQLVLEVLMIILLLVVLATLTREQEERRRQRAVELEIARRADEQRRADAAEQEQKKAPVHHINRARRLSGDLWMTGCSCGWLSAPCMSSSDALDEAEKHKANMPVRRAG